jgi:predicted permease
MKLISSIRTFLDFLFQRRRVEREMEEELRSHIQIRSDELERQGLSSTLAERQARVEFGGYERYREECRDALATRLLGELMADVRYGVRQLRRNPGFTAVAVITLGLGIAANTAIFSIVSSVLLRKPPVRNPDKVMMVLPVERAKGWGDNPEHLASAPDFLDWRNSSRTFDEMAAVEPWDDFTLTGHDEPEHVAGMRTSANFFHLLGVNPPLGRTFVDGEDEHGRDHVAILSDSLWQNHFASDPSVVGKTVKLNGESYTVVAVMPASFKLLDFPTQVWIPLAFDQKQLGPAGRQTRSFLVFGRVKAEATGDQAQAEMATISRHMEQSYPDADKGWEARLLSLQEFVIQDFYIRPALMMLMGAVGLVLLIACANIAGLLLARGAGRKHEIAVRSAMGAGRVRLVRQFLSENILTGLAGAGVGLLLAWWGIRVLHAALSYNEWVKSLDFGIDTRVLVFTVGLSLLTVLLSGLVPALQVSRSDLQATLKEGGRAGGVGVARDKARRVFVVAEVALALVLLTGAGLMIKSFLETIGVDPGFNPRGLLTANVSLPISKYGSPPQQAAFFQQVTEKLQSLPGAVSAATATNLPLAAGAGNIPFSIEGRPATPPKERPQAREYTISPDYLSTMEIPLTRGRAFTNFDNQNAPPVALVNEAFARRFFPKQDAVGQHISIETEVGVPSPRREIVGVVGNVKDYFGQPSFNPQIYLPYVQAPSAEMTLAVRTKGDPATLSSAVRAAVWSVDKDQPLGNVMSMSELIDARGAAGDRLMGELLGIFAALALILAAVGIYGIIAHGVTQRAHEMGIRMALGAGRAGVLRLVVGEGMRLAAIGLAIGFVVAYPLPHLFGAAFEGFSVHPTGIFVLAPALVGLAAFLASYIPARRATKVDPMVALRYE